MELRINRVRFNRSRPVFLQEFPASKLFLNSTRSIIKTEEMKTFLSRTLGYLISEYICDQYVNSWDFITQSE